MFYTAYKEELHDVHPNACKAKNRLPEMDKKVPYDTDVSCFGIFYPLLTHALYMSQPAIQKRKGIPIKLSLFIHLDVSDILTLTVHSCQDFNTIA